MVLEDINLENLGKVSKAILDNFPESKIICLNAKMGSGKTTFAKELCRFLGVKTNVSSPTYSIVNEYKNEDNKTIFHFDLYRLKNKQELIEIGFEDYIFSNNVCLIEWPELALEFLDSYIEISIEKQSDAYRKFTITQKEQSKK